MKLKIENLKFKIVVALLLCTTVAFADIQVTGLITSEDKEPLIGAAVHVVGTSVGTITDIDGKYTLSVPDNTKEVEISYMGYKTVKVPVKNGQASAVLHEEVNTLQEVVAIGYGSVKRGDITNAVAQIKGDELAERPVPNIASALQGELAGVEISSTSGAPGSDVTIKVRGATSINEDANSNPLFVVDGIPMDEDFSMLSLNPQDIQSIEVLKDASSSAIYGSRGANGVILITSKRGKDDGKLTVNVSTNFSVSTPERLMPVMSPEDWIKWRSTINYQNYINGKGTLGAQVGDSYVEQITVTDGSAGTSQVNDPLWSQPGYGGLNLVDWQKAMFRPAFAQNYNISITQGSKLGNFRASIGYVKQDGIVINTGYQRLNAKLTGAVTLAKKLTITIDVAPQYSATTGGNVDGKDNAAMSALVMVPVTENEAGLYTTAEPYSRYLYAGSGVSPVALMEQRSYRDEQIRIASNLKISYEIIKGLKAEVLGSWIFNNRERKTFTPSSADRRWNTGEGYYASAAWNGSRSHKWMAQALLTYDNTFADKHHLNVVAGWSLEASKYGATYSMAGTHFPNNTIQGWTINDITPTTFTATHTTDDRLISYFARAEYGYDNRYLINVSVRRDGSSRFGANKKWGTFPAVSVAWRISDEHFWDQNWAVNQLKIRASYGSNGSNAIPLNSADALLTSSYYSSDGLLTAGYIPSSSASPDLSWQKTDSWNIGLDVAFLNNRISFAADYYQKYIRDMLYQVTMPSVIGYNKGWSNIGNVRTQGVELELKTENIATSTFQWTTKVTAAWSTNKVVSLGDNSAIYTGYDNKTQIIEVGHPVGEYYLYIADGVYMTEEDLVSYPKEATSGLGSVRYRDVNNDGIINERDRTYVGKPQPDWVFGMTNTFRWHDFDASILFTAQVGGEIWQGLGRAIDMMNQGTSINRLDRWQNMWMSVTQPGDGTVPAASNASGAEEFSTRWLYSTDFFKIKNINVGYRFRFGKEAFVKSLRLNLSVENVYMFDKYKNGYSPESNNAGSSIRAWDYGAYPSARTYALGLQLQL